MSDATRPVRLIQDEEILAWIRREGVRTYRYKANLPGAYFLIICSILATVIVTVMAWFLGLGLWYVKGAILLVIAFSCWVWGTVAHWGLYALRRYVAVGPDAVMVGRGAKAYLIPIPRIDASTVHVHRMQRGKLTSCLPVEIDDYRTTIHLIGPFANMESVQLFIADILELLLEENHEDRPSVDDVAIVDGNSDASESPL